MSGERPARVRVRGRDYLLYGLLWLGGGLVCTTLDYVLITLDHWGGPLAGGAVAGVAAACFMMAGGHLRVHGVLDRGGLVVNSGPGTLEPGSRYRVEAPDGGGHLVWVADPQDGGTVR